MKLALVQRRAAVPQHRRVCTNGFGECFGSVLFFVDDHCSLALTLCEMSLVDFAREFGGGGDRCVVNRFKDALIEIASKVRIVRAAELVKHISETLDANTKRAMIQVGSFGFRGGIPVAVDDLVKIADDDLNDVHEFAVVEQRALRKFVVEGAHRVGFVGAVRVLHKHTQTDTSEGTAGVLLGGRVLDDLGAITCENAV